MKKDSELHKPGRAHVFSIFNPIIEAVLVSLLIGVYFYAHHSGYQERVAEDQAEIARLNDEARTKEQQVATKFSQLNSQLKKAKYDIKTTQTSINARIDSGELQLPSTSCAVHSTTDTSSGDGDKGSESTKQVLKDIGAVIAEGDSAIEDYNSCVRKYNEVRDRFNKASK